jgi:hypothetical protein
MLIPERAVNVQMSPANASLPLLLAVEYGYNATFKTTRWTSDQCLRAMDSC